MPKVLVTESYLTDIADAIREGNGTAATYTPAQMGDAIRANGSGFPVPDYWAATLDTKIAAINTLRAGIVNPFSTIFITDVHLEDNNKKSPALMHEIMLRTGVNSAVCGGDLIVRQTAKADAQSLISGWVRRCKDMQMVNLCGNHDLNSEPQNSGAGWMTYAEWFALTRQSADGVTWYTHNGDVTGFGYRDHPAQKIREAFINTGANSAQDDDYHFAAGLGWLYDGLKLLDSSWGVILYAHKFWQPTGHMVEQNPAQYIKSYLVQRASQISAEIIALVTGHCHDDYVDYDPDLGYLIISTTCDAGTAQAALDEVNPTRTPGTTLEQAFDVLTIDRANKILYATRIGAGSDRAVSTIDTSTCAITYSLSNVTSSSSVASVTKHDSYSTTVTANQGYAMSSVTVMMGGVDVTSSVYNSGTGAISIADVTGNVVITATAVGVKPTWTNLVPTSLATNGAVFNTSGYEDGQYLSNTTSTFRGGADANYTLTGRIAYTKADFDAGKEIFFSGISWVNESHSRIAFCSSLTSATSSPYCNGSATGAGNTSNIRTYFTLTEFSDFWKLTPIPGAITNTTMAYFACSLKGSGASLSIGII